MGKRTVRGLVLSVDSNNCVNKADLSIDLSQIVSEGNVASDLKEASKRINSCSTSAA